MAGRAESSIEPILSTHDRTDLDCVAALAQLRYLLDLHPPGLARLTDLRSDYWSFVEICKDGRGAASW